MSYTAAPSVITRPASTSLLAISSKDRYQSYDAARSSTVVTNVSPYDFTITKSESIMNGYFTRLGCSEFSMDWTLPNINYYTSHMLVKYQAGGTGPSIIDTISILNRGFYSPSELATALQTIIRGLDASLTSFTITYGTYDEPGFLYNTNNSTKIAFSPMSPTLDVQPSIEVYYGPTQKQLFDVLGFFYTNTLLSTNGGGKNTFANYTDFVDVTCSTLTYNQPLKDTTSQPVVRDALVRVYLNQVTGPMNSNILTAGATGFAPTGTRPFQIYHNYTHPKQIAWRPDQPVGQLKFVLYDDGGNPLEVADPLSNANWSMTLLVTEN